MACRVEIQDIFREVKNDLLDIDGVKPTPSGVFYSYTKDNNSIPKSLSQELQTQRELYKTNVYGDIFKTSKEDNGLRIDITPPQELATAMTAQNEADEQGRADSNRAGMNHNERYLFDSRRTVNMLSSTRAKQIFEEGQNKGWGLDRTLTEVGVPEVQKQTILSKVLKDNNESTSIRSTLFELEPDISPAKINEIYNNYANLMGKHRKNKQIPKSTFENLLKTFQVFKYKDTYIFGHYDTEKGVFITRLNSSPSSKELLAEALPKLVEQGIDFISFVPKDVATKYERSGYTISEKGFDYNFKGEDMVKYAAVSNPNVSKKVFGKDVANLTAKEIKEYNKSQDLKYNPVNIQGDLVQKAGKDTAKIFETYLGQFGIVVKDINIIKEELGIDELGFADILSKIAYVENKENLPEVAGEFIAYMMQYNPLVSDIIEELSQTDNYKNLDKKEYFKIIGELISKDLQNKVDGDYSKSLVGKIKELLERFFELLKTTPVNTINKNIGIISNNILQQNKNLITSSLYKPGAFGKKTKQVSLQDALDSDKFGATIIDKLSKEGFILTGSTSLGEQGTIQRPDENLLHDIDWVSPFTRTETKDKFLKEYPDATFVRSISSEEYTTDSWLIAPEGYRIANYKTLEVVAKDGSKRVIVDSYDVVNRVGKVKGTYKKEGKKEIVTGVEGKVIDFFSYENYQQKGPFNKGEVKLANWKEIFKAKLEFGRYKDIWDYNRFNPTENQFSLREKSIQALEEQSGMPNSSLHSSRRNSNPNSQEPQGNNYTEFVRYKQTRLQDIQNEITRLNTTLKNNTLSSNTDVVEVNRRIKALEKEVSVISRQLESLKQEEPKYMFHAILEDLANLERALESDNIVDVNKVNNRINFYQEFISGENAEFRGQPLSEYDNPAYDFIAGKIQKLNDLATAKILKTSRESIENSTLVQNLVENNENLDTDDLFQAQKDLGWLETWTLGVTADRTNNTIIPQALYRLLRSTLTKKQSTIEGWNKQLQKLIKENPELNNPDFIKEKDAEGNETGFITDLFSPKYYKAMVKYKKLMSKFIEDSSEVNYSAVLDELLKHNNVIDFTRIRAVRDLYENTYPDYFNSTEEDMDSYEESLRKGLGPKYDEVINQVLNRLALFEEKKVDAQAESGAYVARDLASQNIWEFNEIMKGGSKYRKVKYTHEEQTYGVLFKDFNNVTFLPKTSSNREVMTDQGPVVRSEDTGYYNTAFQEIAANPAKLEYWNLIKNMSEYISSTYDKQTYGRLSYPKVQKEYAERLQENLKDRHLGKLFASTAHEYKSWFYERGRVKEDNTTVSSNYVDSFQSDVRKLAKSYIAQGTPKNEAYTKARQEILDTFSGDFNSNMIAVAMEAALHDARLEVQPMAQAYIKYFKSIDKTRKNAIQKLEHFYEKIILNSNEKYRGSGKAEGRSFSEGTWLNRLLALLEKIPYLDRVITEKSTYLLSDSEKKIFSQLKKLKKEGSTNADYNFELDGVSYFQKKGKTYEAIGEDVQEIDNATFQSAFQEHIQEQISSLGLDLNLAGGINGILKTVIFKGLGLNPISGIFNRIEGKHSSMIMDATGEYWTTGNIDVANNLMNFANITRLSRGRLTPAMGKRKETLQIFDTLVKQFNILQDRKNELQRSAEEAKFNRELLNPYMFAVENPEYKNQGSIIMAVLMDKMVTDVDGNVVPFLDKETGKFNIYNYNEGKLELKEEFRTAENVTNYENFTGENIENLVLKMTDAVSRSQGNYDSLDIMMAKKSIWGRAATLFMTWFAEHINQRFGTSGDKNYNLNTGKKRRHGRFIEAYRANKLNTTVAAFTGLTVAYGIGAPVFAALGVGGLGIMVYKKFVGNLAGPKAIKRDIKYGQELVEFTRSLLIESLNYPGRIFNVGSKVRINNNSFEKTNMSKEEIAAMRSLTRELAIVLSWLAVKLAMGALLYDDEDDKASPQRMKHNFIQNQLSRAINALTIYTNPNELVTDQSRVAALGTLQTVWKILAAVWNEKQQEDLGKNLLDLSPIPRILTKKELPWHNKMNYDEMSNFSGIPSPMKWTSDFFKDVDSGGEKGAEKQYREILADLREELKEELMSKHGGKKKPLKKEIDGLIKSKINGYKKKDQTYSEKLEELKKLGL